MDAVKDKGGGQKSENLADISQGANHSPDIHIARFIYFFVFRYLTTTNSCNNVPYHWGNPRLLYFYRRIARCCDTRIHWGSALFESYNTGEDPFPLKMVEVSWRLVELWSQKKCHLVHYFAEFIINVKENLSSDNLSQLKKISPGPLFCWCQHFELDVIISEYILQIEWNLVEMFLIMNLSWKNQHHFQD